MDEYSFEIETTDARNRWTTIESNRTVTAFNESEANDRAREYAEDHYVRWRIKNLRLSKKYTNPDGEI